ncbi:hypothetical protein [Sphingobacterium bovisgrunnientis]|uniref:hypothetical protein n=1 Tax=Sphingobacterium bovisgrunnientis TaxID=1874697 RepID=UPI0013580994|nr:hypothetical protein [Sphingobacterium bovisgrunnientis]
MIKRRIHTLKATISSSQEPYEDANGNIIFPDGSSEVVERSCRAESNTLDGRTKGTDVFNFEYNYLVFTDTKIKELPYSTPVEITIDKTGEIFGKGEVVKFERGQRVTRIWLK